MSIMLSLVFDNFGSVGGLAVVLWFWNEDERGAITAGFTKDRTTKETIHMSKTLNIASLEKLISGSKVDGVTKVGVTDSFRKEVFNAAVAVDKVIEDVTPIAVNLYHAHRIFVTPTGTNLSPAERKIVGSSSMTSLLFFKMFDSTITWDKIPKDGTPERKAYNSHRVLNRLAYLVRIGKVAAGHGPAPRSPKVAAEKAKAFETRCKAYVKKWKLGANAFSELVLDILRLRSKDGKMTAKGRKLMKAAGFSVAE